MLECRKAQWGKSNRSMDQLKLTGENLGRVFNSRMEQHTLKNVNNYLNTNIYSYLETHGGQSSILY